MGNVVCLDGGHGSVGVVVVGTVTVRSATVRRRDFGGSGTARD